MRQMLLLAAFVICAAVPGRGQNKLAPDVSLSLGRSSLDVIVQFHSKPTDRHHDTIRGRGGELDAFKKNVVSDSKTNVVWGSSGTQAFDIFWGSYLSVVWDDSTNTGLDSSVVWGESTSSAQGLSLLLHGES